MFFNFLFSTQSMPVAELKSWGDVIFGSFLNLLSSISSYFPSIAGALLVVFFGLPIAHGVARVVEKVAKKFKISDVISRVVFIDRMEKSGLKIDLAVALGKIAKWIVILLILVLAAQILSLAPIVNFLEYLLAVFIPRLVVSILILIVGLILAEPVYHGVRGSAEAAIGIDLATLVAVIAKWAVVIVTALTALEQLGIQLGLLKILFTGIVGMAAIAGGLAFGLGGQYKARELLEKINRGHSR